MSLALNEDQKYLFLREYEKALRFFARNICSINRQKMSIGGREVTFYEYLAEKIHPSVKFNPNNKKQRIYLLNLGLENGFDKFKFLTQVKQELANAYIKVKPYYTNNKESAYYRGNLLSFWESLALELKEIIDFDPKKETDTRKLRDYLNELKKTGIINESIAPDVQRVFMCKVDLKAWQKQKVLLMIINKYSKTFMPFLTSEEITSTELVELSRTNSGIIMQPQLNGDYILELIRKHRHFENTVCLMFSINAFIREHLFQYTTCRERQYELIRILGDFATFIKPTTILILFVFHSPYISFHLVEKIKIDKIHIHLCLVQYIYEQNANLSMKYFKHKTPEEFKLQSQLKHEEIFRDMEFNNVEMYNLLTDAFEEEWPEDLNSTQAVWLCSRREIKKLINMGLEPTQFQKSIINGLLIGDGHITPTGEFVYGQSVIHREYFDYVSYLLHNLISSINYQFQSYPTISNGKYNLSYSFRGYRLLFFENLRRIWYPDGKKVIPMSFQPNLINLAFAIMDDGSYNSGISIHTMGFSENDVKVFCDKINQFFYFQNSPCSTKKVLAQGKLYPVTFLSKELSIYLARNKSFMAFIINAMQYKISGGKAHYYRPSPDFYNEINNQTKLIDTNKVLFPMTPMLCNCGKYCWSPFENYHHFVTNSCKTYTCSLCNIKGRNISHHHPTHFPLGLFKCILESCNMKGCSKSEVNTHYLNKHLLDNNIIFECRECDFQGSRLQLYNHNNTLHRGCHYKCPDCNKDFCKYDAYHKHILNHANVYLCTLCPQNEPSSFLRLSHQSAAYRHFNNIHGEKSIVKCLHPECKNINKMTLESYRDHVKIHWKIVRNSNEID